MTYYLGKPGALVALPDPEVGLPQTVDRVGGTHQLLSGARVRDTIGRMRTWNLSWTALDLTTYSTLELFYYAAAGAGPYYFIDPEQRNLLGTGVSTAVGAGLTFPSNVTGTRSPNWTSQFWQDGTLQLAENSTVLSGASQDVVTASKSIPVVPGLSYAISAYFHLDGTTPGHYVGVWWQDSNGSAIGALEGNVIATGGTGVSSNVGVAPVGAVYAGPRAKTAANNTTGGTVFAYTNSWQFERSSSVSTWVTGTGTPLVTVESLSRSTPLAGLCDVQMTLVQVG